jgi:phospholipid/cholesterol/gamma-HCH transport system permease protein
MSAGPAQTQPGRLDRALERLMGQRGLTFGDAVDFSWRTIRGVARIKPYFTEVLRQATILAQGSVLIVLALVFAFGLVLGIQSSYGARLIGAPSLSALGPSLGGLRELIPYAFGYMMAAKVSTGYVAEIGTARITEEVDALEVMGVNSVAYLCTTRVLATWLLLPLIYGLAVLVGFIASYLAVVVQIGSVSSGGYLELFWQFQSAPDFLFSGFKGLLMGTFVVLVGVYYGYRVRGGPVEVGSATARAMVVNLIGIHIIGVLTSELFWGGQARLPIGG